MQGTSFGAHGGDELRCPWRGPASVPMEGTSFGAHGGDQLRCRYVGGALQSVAKDSMFARREGCMIAASDILKCTLLCMANESYPPHFFITIMTTRRLLARAAASPPAFFFPRSEIFGIRLPTPLRRIIRVASSPPARVK